MAIAEAQKSLHTSGGEPALQPFSSTAGGRRGATVLSMLFLRPSLRLATHHGFHADVQATLNHLNASGASLARKQSLETDVELFPLAGSPQCLSEREVCTTWHHRACFYGMKGIGDGYSDSLRCFLQVSWQFRFSTVLRTWQWCSFCLPLSSVSVPPVAVMVQNGGIFPRSLRHLNVLRAQQRRILLSCWDACTAPWSQASSGELPHRTIPFDPAFSLDPLCLMLCIILACISIRVPKLLEWPPWHTGKGKRTTRRGCLVCWSTSLTLNLHTHIM